MKIILFSRTRGYYRNQKKGINRHMEDYGEAFPRQRGAPPHNVQRVHQERYARTPLEVLLRGLFRISS